jgi:hypothetical protein
LTASDFKGLCWDFERPAKAFHCKRVQVMSHFLYLKDQANRSKTLAPQFAAASGVHSSSVLSSTVVVIAYRCLSDTAKVVDLVVEATLLLR